ncbi:uncharacterized protein LOC130234282 [Danio aesculapii]|uniref:uncharacterized protein LOC130234282 n=1 Tax=Danio aesculapii TaxID=1142201 RepID=UPI0024C0C674|nr:uncharacterized protein LOC130234282 [Danio aesculapii]
MKMKLIFFLLVLLKNGMNLTEGLTVSYSSGRITLRYFFNLYYNTYEISCCKLNQLRCYFIVNNRGVVDSMYQGRISISMYSGELEVIITNLSEVDAGTYQCGVAGIFNTYEVVHVLVYNLRVFSGVNTAPLLPKATIKPTFWISSPSTPSVSEQPAEKSSDGWSTFHMLAVVLSVLVFVVISLILLAYRLKKKKKDKSGTCGSSNITMTQDDTTYCMVEFLPHQDQCQIYANFQIRRPEDTAHSVIAKENVEYSIISQALP